MCDTGSSRNSILADALKAKNRSNDVAHLTFVGILKHAQRDLASSPLAGTPNVPQVEVYRSKLYLALLRDVSICLHRAYEVRNHAQCQTRIDAPIHELSLPN